MMCLSLWQPFASLIALREKPFETRSWETNYRGPLAIHAAKTKQGIDDLPGDCEGKEEVGWIYGYIGDFQACYLKRGKGQWIGELTDLRTGETDNMPFGAIVAICDMTGCYGTPSKGSTFREYYGGLRLPPPEPECFYGDFSPNRFAWHLENVRALKEPIPLRGAQGLFNWDAPLDLEELLK